MIYRRQLKNIQGWMRATELQWLYSQAKKYKSIVEIGCWKGKSTHALLSGQEPGGIVVAIDHFQGAKGQEEFFTEVAYLDIYHIFMANVGHFDNLRVIKGNSVDAAGYVGDAEMVFIDGDHSYEGFNADLDAWTPKCTKLLCGHDYQFLAVKTAIIERFGLPRVVDSIWYVNVESSGT